jgi:4,5-dihydroxyphthalate decarboxylase
MRDELPEDPQLPISPAAHPHVLAMSSLTDATAPRVPLSTLLGDYPTTHALRQGVVTSPILSLAFADVAVPNTAFKRAVRDLEFDVAELALMTFLMARSRGVALRLLPVVVFSRNPLPHFVCCPQHRRVTPSQLGGRRVGVRAYTTTTAVWVRELLADQFDVNWNDVTWVTLDEGHVQGVTDPPNVHRDPAASDLLAMLRAGAIDAAIVDRIPPDPAFAPVVPEPDAACRAWEQKHGARTLNHVITVRESLATNEALVRELFRLFQQSRELGGAAVDRSAAPLGFESNRRNLEMALAVADAQGLLAHPLTVEDLVTSVLASLE